jgi:hypothetical protein
VTATEPREADRDTGRAPNPGSDTAVNLGCTCPPGRNHHGEFPVWAPDGWVIGKACPVHAVGWRHGSAA